MNNQLATVQEAAEIANQLGAIGGGVIDTYIPQYEGPFQPPAEGDAKFLHFRFLNGADGFNVGLIRAFMQYSPLRWPLMVGAEVEAARKVPVSVVPVGDPKPTDPPAKPAYCPIDFSREIVPGQWAMSAEDTEPINGRFIVAGVPYVKRDVPNGMMSKRVWVKA